MEIQIISGFLGAGKTTFLNQYLPALPGKTAVIENEFGDIGLDGELISGEVPVKELYAGCICCSLVSDLQQGILDIIQRYMPDRILIEPSGIGRLSDVEKACRRVSEKHGIELGEIKRITIVDAASYEDFIDGFGAFYRDQIQSADYLFLSRQDQLEKEQLNRIVDGLKQENPDAVIYCDDWRQLDPEELAGILTISGFGDRRSDGANQVSQDSISFVPGNVFESISIRRPRKMTETELEQVLKNLDEGQNGQVLRAKGIVETPDGLFLHFDLTNSDFFWEKIRTDTDGCRVIIIGRKLNKTALEILFKNHISIRVPVRGGTKRNHCLDRREKKDGRDQRF